MPRLKVRLILVVLQKLHILRKVDKNHFKTYKSQRQRQGDAFNCSEPGVNRATWKSFDLKQFH